MISMIWHKWSGLLIIAVLLLSLIPGIAQAATTSAVTVTVQPILISIVNAPTTYGFGSIAMAGTPTTTAGYFTITNTSGGTAINLSVYADNFTGGVGWALASNASPGTNIAGMYAGIVSGTFNTVVTVSPGNVLKSGLSASTNQTWHLKLMAPTEYTDAVLKTTTVTVSAAAT